MARDAKGDHPDYLGCSRHNCLHEAQRAPNVGQRESNVKVQVIGTQVSGLEEHG